MEKPSKVADKIVIDLYKNFIATGNKFTCGENLVKAYPDVPEHIVFTAIDMLSKDGYLNVLYADDAPQEIEFTVSAVQNCDENTLTKRGYEFLKELRDWL